MFFSRALSFAVLALGISSAAATPAAMEKRDVSDVLNVVQTLKSSTDAILPQLDALAVSDTANEDTVSPVLVNLVAALNTASTSFHGLKGKVDSTSASKEDVANAIALVYSDITKSLNNFKKHKPHLGWLYVKYGIDSALHNVLFGLELILGGVLKLVATLLFAVGELLKGLGFLLTGALLGFVKE